MFTFWDYLVFVIYGLVIVGVGLWVSREKKGHIKDTEDYFLAGKALPWWAIGASLIAANISAEQFIGMSGSGFAIGLGIASYEWMGAATLIIVGKYFLPVFLDKKIFTMPQFLEVRYDSRLRVALAIFWLLVYVFINLTSVMYLGALALETIMDIPLMYGIAGLAVFAALYSIYGGLKAVAWTDVIQVIFLVAGGLITTWLALDAIADKFGGNGPIAGFAELVKNVPEKFDMIIQKGILMIPDGSGSTKDAYIDLPGISVLVGGMWVANLAYFGFNQYIIQRGLAAKNIDHAQKGMIFAGFLKLLTPLIIVIPGIAAYLLTKDTGTVIEPSDKAYPWLLHSFVPTGIKGLCFAALAAAIVSSLASMLNSTSTIFTLDIYSRLINKGASKTQLVKVGRFTAFAALVIAVIAARPMLGGLDQAFQFIQDFTGMITPGVLAIFGIGMFWRKAKANAALWIAILTIPLGVAFKYWWFPNMPFIDRMGVVFLILSAILIVLSLLESKEDDPKSLQVRKNYFKTSKGFNTGATIICLILLFLYTMWW